MRPIWRYLVLLSLPFSARIYSSVSYNHASYHIQWYAPFFAPCGFGSEAISYMIPLHDALDALGRGGDVSLVNFALPISAEYFDGLPYEYKISLLALARNGNAELQSDSSRLKIVVCHSTADYWYPSAFEGWDEVSVPSAREQKDLQDRAYDDRFPTTWYEKYVDFDEIWVPTQFHYNAILRDKAIDAGKVKIVPQAVDTEFFRRRKVKRDDATYRFLSVFKWEYRKGWDVLLQAFIEEFNPEIDDVELVIKTSEFHADEPIRKKIEAWAKEEGLSIKDKRFRLVLNDVPTRSLPRLYSQHDAFVIASRGEGWCRPLAESMAIGLPVVATNFSGMTEFMSKDNSFAIKVEGMEEVPNMKGHFWAKPSVSHLRQTMRYLTEHRAEAKAVGSRGRRDMKEKYSFDVTAARLIQRFDDIFIAWWEDIQHSKTEL